MAIACSYIVLNIVCDNFLANLVPWCIISSLNMVFQPEIRIIVFKHSPTIRFLPCILYNIVQQCQTSLTCLLEVCRENQRQKCSRSDAECKFAHPPANVEVQNGRVTACYDSIKVGGCEYFIFHLFAVFSRYLYNNFQISFSVDAGSKVLLQQICSIQLKPDRMFSSVGWLKRFCVHVIAVQVPAQRSLTSSSSP